MKNLIRLAYLVISRVITTRLLLLCFLLAILSCCFSLFESTSFTKIEPNHAGTTDISLIDGGFQSLERCRSIEDLNNIPWTKQTTTFYNLGYPLIKDLCPRGTHTGHHNYRDNRLNSDRVYLGCDLIKRRHWSKSISNATKRGQDISAILVDPPCIDDGGASSGVFTVNAVFSFLFNRGYNVRVRNWSPGLNNSFSKETVHAAMLDSSRWLTFLDQKGPNPFDDVEDYVAFQGSVGTQYYMKPQPDITSYANGSGYSRHLRWMIGSHHVSTHKHYQSNKHHCVGGNFFVGEGLHCPSSSIIALPMFPFHLQQSLDPVDPGERLKQKENIILLDNDAVEYSAAEIEAALKAMGIPGKESLHTTIMC